MKIGKNQYLLAPQVAISAAKIDYRTSFTFEGYGVYLGEECQHMIVRGQNRSALLIGYIVSAADATETTRLLERFLDDVDDDARNIAECTSCWGGRWCLAFTTPKGMHVITDACGLKQVFYYTYLERRNVTIASQSRYIAELYCLPVNKNAQSYIGTAQKIDKEFSWPLDGTLYERVRRLLPNYILREGEKVPNRFAFYLRESKTAAQEMSALLRKQMHNIQDNNKCAVTVTAGWDSRLALSATDKTDKDLVPVTLQYLNAKEDSLDIQTAREICKEVGLEHTLVRCSEISPIFKGKYYEHSETPHDYWIQMSQAIEDAGLEDYIWIKGSCNEILRKSSGVLKNWQVTDKLLCRVFDIHYDDYSSTIIKNWIKDAMPFCRQHKINVLDLFYWEHRCGSWLAECLNEADVVGEMFSPFNCRAYIALGLSAHDKYRVSPDYHLFEEILEENSFCLKTQINRGRYSSFKSRLKCMLKNRLPLLYGPFLNSKPLR